VIIYTYISYLILPLIASNIFIYIILTASFLITSHLRAPHLSTSSSHHHIFSYPIYRCTLIFSYHISSLLISTHEFTIVSNLSYAYIPPFTSSLHRNFSLRIKIIDFTHQIYLAIYHLEYHHIFSLFSYPLRTHLSTHATYSLSIILIMIIITI
jgi:hypothetical protein